MTDVREKVARAIEAFSLEGTHRVDDRFRGYHAWLILRGGNEVEEIRDGKDAATRRMVELQAQAALDAIGYDPETHVIVPREPNHDITAAVVKSGEDRTWAVNIYKAMIEASQQ